MAGIFLVLCGVALALTLPSNAFFILAVFVSGLLKIFLSGNGDGIYYLKKATPFLISFFLMFALIALYFFSIREGLNNGIVNYSQSTLSFKGFLKIGEFLFDPWGTWLFLLFVLGLVGLKENENFLFVLALLAVPLALTIVSGIVGFPRVYIYLLPFLLLVAGVGLEFLFNRLHVQKPLLASSLIGVAVLMVAIQFYQWAALYYPGRTKIPNGTLKEARLVKDYINSEVSFDSLLVFMVYDPEGNALVYYLSDQIKYRMKLFLAGKEIKKILFISHARVPPDKFPLITVFDGKTVKIPPSYLLKVKEFGDLHLYEFTGALSRWIPEEGRRDLESVFNGASGSTYQAKQVKNPKLFGSYSLQVNTAKGKEVLLQSPIFRQVEIKSSPAFILHIFAKTLGKTRFIFSDSLEKRVEYPMALLNPYLGLLDIESTEQKWEMVFSLSQLNSGRYRLGEILWSQDESVFVDEPQSYLLSKEKL
ncbi:MAG: hypothetical protein HOG63_00380 [Nitrospina sp.]|nr:hypothetical protein [Nitrospina sp.]MBT3856963.1 hypothetical protein [Nitrospina sp.]MBT4621284.1 hypothetical protein [Nitrospina sp.]MBT4897891.1 hypothetical protein [Nitrospina sp.]MBT5957005.1 hypothetical protein [Nitrospina sp.]